MPVNLALAHEEWQRYIYMRDNGHLDYVAKANKCDAYYCGDQWDRGDKAALDLVKRPALTINKILATIDSLTGDQINTRTETTFKPLHASGENLSTVLELLYKQTSQNNMLQWLETDVFEDGAITSRGFYDVRLDFKDSMKGEVRITVPNPRNILIDPDAEQYDPETWKDFSHSKWLSPNDIEILYNKEDADYLKGNNSNPYSSDIDAIQRGNERIGGMVNYFASEGAQPEIQRNIRVIDRQHKKLAKAKYFVDLNTGDMRPIPTTWDREKIGMVMKAYGLGVVDRVVERIRWTTTAGGVVLHDEWSPYQYLTIVPYFPHFRHGKTLGVVENLLDPQELLNKVSSQELHVVNTTANSGWKIKTGSLQNMSTEELEQRGAQTGIVLSLENPDDAEKIQPNQIPTGLERISFKAEEHIKTISNVTDNALGNDREDVAAKAIKAKRQRSGVSQLRIQDNLLRTKYMLAKRVLALFQGFYTEPRIYRITFDNPIAAAAMENEEDQFIKLNQFSDAVNRITNDLTLGEYDVVITTMPPKDTQEESEFDQAVAMKQLGLQIPDDVIIGHSLLREKRDLVRRLTAAAQSPEVQQQKQLTLAGQTAQVELVQAQGKQTEADALLKTATAQGKAAEIATAAPGQPGKDGGTDLASQVLQNRADRAAQAADHGLRREEMGHEAAMKAADQQHESAGRAADQEHEVNTKVMDKAISDDDGDRANERAGETSKVAHKQAKEINDQKTAGAIKVAKAKPKTTPKKAPK